MRERKRETNKTEEQPLLYGFLINFQVQQFCSPNVFLIRASQLLRWLHWYCIKPSPIYIIIKKLNLKPIRRDHWQGLWSIAIKYILRERATHCAAGHAHSYACETFSHRNLKERSEDDNGKVGSQWRGGIPELGTCRLPYSAVWHRSDRILHAWHLHKQHVSNSCWLYVKRITIMLKYCMFTIFLRRKRVSLGNIKGTGNIVITRLPPT